MDNKKTLFILIGAYPDVGKGILAGSIGYLFNKYNLKTSIIKFDGYFNTNSGNMNPYSKLPDLSYSEEEVFVLKDGYQTDADHGYYERFLNQELTGNTCITNGSLFEELLNKIKSGEYKSGEILKYKTLRKLLKQKIYDSFGENNFLVLEVGGTIGDEEVLQLYKTLNEVRSEGVIETKVILLSPYLCDEEGNKTIELSSRTKITRKAFIEAVGFGFKPDFLFLRNKVSVLENDIDYISEDCNLDKKFIFLDPQFSNIYSLPEHIEKQGFMRNFIKEEKKIIGRLENYNNAKDNLVNAPNLIIGIFGKTMSYDSYISLKEAIEHAGVQSGISVKIEWIDDYLINGKEVPLKYFDGIIIGEGRNFINEKLFLIKYARKIKIPLLAISFGADLLIKEYCEEDLNVEVALEKNSELYLGSKMTKLSEKSKISEIYSSNDILERYRISKGLPNSIAKKISGSIAITGITSDNVPAVFEIPGEDFILGVRFHPEYTSRPGNPNPLILEFIKKCSSLKKKLAIEQIKILIAEKLR